MNQPKSSIKPRVHATLGAALVLAVVAGGSAQAQTSVQVQSTPAVSAGVGATPTTTAPTTASGTQAPPPTTTGTSAASRPSVQSNSSVQTQIAPPPAGSGPAAPGSTGGGVGAPSGLTVYGAGNPPGMAPNVIGGTTLPSTNGNGQGTAGKPAQAGGLQQMSPANSGNNGQAQGPGLVIIPK